ncbi:hypothetical protein L2E82_16473 [Cichorium intybus]|uniref:Uncharacterized protein n=1 Tax=Cichorium intybus TaxID=13427 RepID=A0ACB9F648_CICIN|nr:hypothetical protein L2E82_16473 [Cichorium intybus]
MKKGEQGFMVHLVEEFLLATLIPWVQKRDGLQTFTSSRKNRAEIKQQDLLNFLDDDEKAQSINFASAFAPTEPKVPVAMCGGSGNYASALYIAAAKANALDKVESKLLDFVSAATKASAFSQYMEDLAVGTLGSDPQETTGIIELGGASAQDTYPDDILAPVLKALIEKTNVNPAEFGDIVVKTMAQARDCLLPMGITSENVAARFK